MADVTKGSDKKNKDSFADDLDAMLNTSDVNTSQHVEMIDADDDDAIDRLLMGDNFQDNAIDLDGDEFAEFDVYMANDIDENTKMNIDVDEIDEFADAAEISEQDTKQDERDEVESFDFDDQEEWDESSAHQIDAEPLVFAEDADLFPESVDEPDVVIAQANEAVNRRVPDDLLAEFDISADDDDIKPVKKPETPVDVSDLPEIIAKPEISVEPEIDLFKDDTLSDLSLDDIDIFAEGDVVQEPNPQLEPQNVPLPEAKIAAPEVQANVAAVDYSGELAALTSQCATLNNQLMVLKKQQLAFKQEMTEKAGKEELVTCLGSIESLQTEQKKTKRSVDAFSQQKPVSAYVANGLAAVALLLGAGLAIQNYIAKTQATEVLQIIGKLQEQVTGAPTSEAADKEMLRKELDGLALADSVTSNQLAEIKKMLSGETGSAKASGEAAGDAGKKLAELSTQIMQMGNAIESLETKVSNLEKGKLQTVVTAPKLEKKKPVVVEENWAVNLIAFRQDWYAKRKAEEYASKGVAVKVSKSESKGEVWYRLSVDGFKSQYEAAGYAAKIKKSLNLDSVWVARVTANAD
ncbi:SPOR domain-containing protein [Methylomonas sp. AM2-LC]|uniref:SPOR domain-containing protein n=1 Tax=Methylomonas sp. AM2-LC TaxID=3153301 RepID=UPI003264121B